MLNHKETVLVIIDVQERMMPVINRNDEVVGNIVRLIQGCTQLHIPMLVTEQYSKGLGNTIPEVREAMGEHYAPIEKMTFSAAGDMGFMSRLEAYGQHTAIICGVETHVCVYQTACELRNLGWDIEVVADAVGSRSERNCMIALEKMTRHGVELTSVEMALFEMMKSADIPQFKAVSNIVK